MLGPALTSQLVSHVSDDKPVPFTICQQIVMCSLNSKHVIVLAINAITLMARMCFIVSENGKLTKVNHGGTPEGL